MVAEGLTFRPGQAVRVEFQLAETAAEEGQFAKLISGFLSKAAAGRQVINEEAEQVQARALTCPHEWWFKYLTPTVLRWKLTCFCRVHTNLEILR